MVTQYRKPFRLEVLAPSGPVCRDEAVSVIFPAVDGEIGVLGGRAPMIARVGAGRLVVGAPEGRQRTYFLTGGFAQVRDDFMTILAEECVPVEELDPEHAWGELQQAKQLPVADPTQRALRQQSLAIARARFNLAQEASKRRQRG